MPMSNSEGRKRRVEAECDPLEIPRAAAARMEQIVAEHFESMRAIDELLGRLKARAMTTDPSIAELLALAWDQGYRAHVHDRNPYRDAS